LHFDVGFEFSRTVSVSESASRDEYDDF
jgi:hypothetical protein